MEQNNQPEENPLASKLLPQALVQHYCTNITTDERVRCMRGLRKDNWLLQKHKPLMSTNLVKKMD
jgi:hypothetical protein